MREFDGNIRQGKERTAERRHINLISATVASDLLRYSPAARNVRRGEPRPDRLARHPEYEEAHPDEHVDQPHAHRTDRHAREEDPPDEIRAVPFERPRQGQEEQDEAEQRDGEEDPYHVAPRHHGSDGGDHARAFRCGASSLSRCGCGGVDELYLMCRPRPGAAGSGS